MLRINDLTKGEHVQENNKGPKTDPYGTPQVTAEESETKLPMFTVNPGNTEPDKPTQLLNLLFKIQHQMQS